jgi:hypothetical protein
MGILGQKWEMGLMKEKSFTSPECEAVAVREAARIAGIGGTLMYEAIREGWGPPTIVVGKRRRLIRLAALREWLRELEAEQATSGALVND